MIIYGTRASRGNFIQTDVQCPFCGKEQAVGVLPYNKYFHIWWIPFVPYGKEYVTMCKDCSHPVPDHYLGPEGVNKDIKKHAKTPIWTFAGPLIILGIFVYIYIANKI